MNELPLGSYYKKIINRIVVIEELFGGRNFLK